MVTRTYDSNKGTMTIGFNRYVPSGFGDGSKIEISRDEPSFTSVTGTDGEVSRSLTHNKMGTVLMTLMQTSPSNGVFSTMLALDEQTGVGLGPFTYTNGKTKYFSPNCWFEKFADLEDGREIKERQWTLKCDTLTIHMAGTE